MTARGVALELAARRTVFRQTVVPGCALLACLLVVAHAPSGVRAPVVITFLCLVPGAALVGLLSPDSLELEIALAIGLSVALSGLTAAILVYTNLWSPTAVVLIVAAISLAAGLRDVELGGRAHRAAHRSVGLLQGGLAGAWHGIVASLFAATAASAAFARRGVRGLPGTIAAASKLASAAGVGLFAATAELWGRVALVARGALSRPAGRRLGKAVAVRSEKASASRPRPVQAAAPAPPAPKSSLQNFLLEELQRRARSNGSRRRRPPRSLAELEPHEVEDLLSWSALQRFVTYRAVGQVEPALWFADDLERRLGRQRPVSPGARPAPRPLHVPRGVWITGVSEGSSVPIAWRVLEEKARGKEWRTRLALEAIDTLTGLAHHGAVVTARTAYGSLSGFRAGLEERGLPYLLRVDAVTAARELAPGRPTSSAEARRVVGLRVAEGATTLVGAGLNGTPGTSVLVLVQGVERLVLCEVPPEGQVSAFWLSNLSAATPPERLASLVRLAHRHDAERTTIHDLLLSTFGRKLEHGAELQQQLALVALEKGLSTLGVSAATGRGAVEA